MPFVSSLTQFPFNHTYINQLLCASINAKKQSWKEIDFKRENYNKFF